MKKSYFMDHPLEGKRLSEKTKSDNIIEKHLLTYLNDNKKILDVGCGPGLISSGIAKKNSNLIVCCCDISHSRLIEAKQISNNLNNISHVAGNVYNLPYKSNTFDFVFSRFLFEYLKKPQNALFEIIRVAKKKANILLQDIEGQLFWHYPEDKKITPKIEDIVKHLNSVSGYDPFIGRKLYYIMYSSNKLENFFVKAEPYNLSWGMADKEIINNWEMKLRIVFPFLCKMYGEQKAKLLKKNCLNYLKREDTLVYSLLFTVAATKK